MVKQIPLKKDLKLNNVLCAKGVKLDAVKVNQDFYKVFHYTGWWQVPVEYFE